MLNSQFRVLHFKRSDWLIESKPIFRKFDLFFNRTPLNKIQSAILSIQMLRIDQTFAEEQLSHLRLYHCIGSFFMAG